MDVVPANASGAIPSHTAPNADPRCATPFARGSTPEWRWLALAWLDLLAVAAVAAPRALRHHRQQQQERLFNVQPSAARHAEGEGGRRPGPACRRWPACTSLQCLQVPLSVHQTAAAGHSAGQTCQAVPTTASAFGRLAARKDRPACGMGAPMLIHRVQTLPVKS